MVSAYARRLGVPCLQYIDDRLNGHFGQRGLILGESECVGAERAVYIVCQLLTRLGYTLALAKCQFIPVQVIPFLGFLVDSIRRAFVVPQEKREKFDRLLRGVLQGSETDMRTLQRVQGRCVSFS